MASYNVTNDFRTKAKQQAHTQILLDVGFKPRNSGTLVIFYGLNLKKNHIDFQSPDVRSPQFK